VSGGGDVSSQGENPIVVSKQLLHSSIFPRSQKRFGARYLGASPSSQLLCQKRAFAPSPRETVVEKLNRRWLTSLQGRSIPAQGLESSVQSLDKPFPLMFQVISKLLPLFSLLSSGIPKSGHNILEKKVSHRINKTECFH
jgi:hypothetical protein